ncbi:MAG TPA: hypothetical protein VIK18_21935 [Pirellulales bacterium]
MAAGLRMAPPPVSWRSWPLAAGGGQVWLILSSILLSFAAIAYASGSVGLAAGGAALVCLAAWRLFVPVVFELGPMGISQQILGRSTRIAWGSIERAQVGRQGIFFSLDGAVLAPLRGLYVPWDGNRDEVLGHVAYFMPRAEGLPPTLASADDSPPA